MASIFRNSNSNIHNFIENRNEEKKEIKKNVKKEIKKPKKTTFKKRKENTLCSLKEVEHFLQNSHSLFNYIKLYKILK